MIKHCKIRGFEPLTSCPGARIPEQATANSAGYDFFAAETVTIKPMAQTEFKPTLVATGIKAYMREDERLEILARSSLGKLGLQLSNCVGLVDADYYNNIGNEGHIFFAFWNHSIFPVTLNKGDKIGQGVFSKFLYADSRQSTAVRKGGYGSTDKD